MARPFRNRPLLASTLEVDVVDYAINWNYGVRSGLETYGHVIVSRAVAVADRPSMFVPPVDIILPAGAPVPRRPYYLMYAPIPYVSRTGSSRFSKLVPGDAVFGGKVRLLTPRGRRPGVAATLELKLPLARDLPHLQSGAGTGGFDQTLRFTGEWRRPRQSLVASLGLTHVERPAFGDRLIVVGPEGDARPPSPRARASFRRPTRCAPMTGSRRCSSWCGASRGTAADLLG